MKNQSLLLTFLVGLLGASLLFSSSAALAVTADFPMKNMKGNEKILISVPQAQVIVTGNPSATSLRITLLEAAADEDTVQVRDNQLEVVAKDSSKDKWGESNSSKKRVIEISGPGFPLEIHLFDGNVTLTKWTKDALVQLQKGKLVAKANTGHLTAHVQKGELDVQGHSGKMTLDSYAAKVHIQELVGDLDLENFSGESIIEKTKGYLSLSLGSGRTKVLSSGGTLQFEDNKGAFQAQAFSGRIEGKTSDGNVAIQMSAEGEINVKSQTGKVTVKAISGQGTLLSLFTSDGEIYLPSYLKVSRDNSGKSFRGRLRGDAQKGSIVVRSQAGNIIVL
jgi:hypothetical protein